MPKYDEQAALAETTEGVLEREARGGATEPVIPELTTTGSTTTTRTTIPTTTTTATTTPTTTTTLPPTRGDDTLAPSRTTVSLRVPTATKPAAATRRPPREAGTEGAELRDAEPQDAKGGWSAVEVVFAVLGAVGVFYVAKQAGGALSRLINGSPAGSFENPDPSTKVNEANAAGLIAAHEQAGERA
jgi:hypothetical protein